MGAAAEDAGAMVGAGATQAQPAGAGSAQNQQPRVQPAAQNVKPKVQQAPANVPPAGQSRSQYAQQGGRMQQNGYGQGGYGAQTPQQGGYAPQGGYGGQGGYGAQAQQQAPPGGYGYGAPQAGPYPGGDFPPPKGSKYAVMSTASYIGHSILFAIPILGFLIVLIMAFAAGNLNKRHFARAVLIFTIIGVILSIIAYFVAKWLFGVVVDAATESLQQSAGVNAGDVSSILNALKQFQGQ
jgi:hypothetical protein